MLLKKSSLDIPLLPEREHDKKIASLLSMKLTSSKSVGENTDAIRKNILAESSLPTSCFSSAKEMKALKVLGKDKQNIGIILKTTDSFKEKNKKIKLTHSLVEDYGSSSNSE